MVVVGLIARRILSAVGVLFVVVTFVFFFMRLVGDPIHAIVGESPTEEAVAAARQRYGFDRPITVQYVDYLAGIVRGEFGISFRYSGQPAMQLVLERLPATMRLAGIALVLGMATALPIGIYSALKPGSWVDNIARVVAVAGQSVPSFWLAILLILLLTYMLSFIDRTAIGVVQEPIKRELGLTDWQLGLLSGPAFGILYALMSLPIARLAAAHAALKHQGKGILEDK